MRHQDGPIHLVIDSTGLKIMGHGEWHAYKHKTSKLVSTPAEDVLEQRNVAILRIVEVGRRHWRTEAGAHQQARAESAMYRYRRTVGDALGGRTVSTKLGT
ncbi:MAG: hypothetical protein ACI9OJ_001321 [Myxococcota bacterium]|jgi:hypothetical protein